MLQLLAEGKSPKDTPVLLNMSVKTVDFHKTRLMEQFNLHSLLALAKFANAEGLVRSSPS